MDKQLFCVGPAPLLWKGLFFVIPALVAIFFILLFYAAIRSVRNKKAGDKILDKRMKTYLLWLALVFLTLVSYGIVGLDFQLYVLVFLVLSASVLVGFFIGEKFGLYKIHQSRWIAMTILLVLFALAFLSCWVDRVRGRMASPNGTAARCSERVLF